MSTVAVLSDIHGNLPALRAVLRDIDTLSPDEVLVGGDLVGRGPQGSAVVRAIAERGWTCVRGNHEDYLLDFRQGRVPDDWLEEEEWAASRWMAGELTDEAVAYISSLPFDASASVAAGLRLIHGSPRSANEGLGPWTPDRKLAGHLATVEENLLVCAHIHRPMYRRVDGGEVVNVGAVGLPFNGDRRAQYALFHHRDGSWTVEFRQVEYDLEETLAVYRRSGFLERGGVTAELLMLELRLAAPYLVPFLKWASAVGIRPSRDRIAEFRDFYDPSEPLHHFFDRLETERQERRLPG